MWETNGIQVFQDHDLYLTNDGIASQEGLTLVVWCDTEDNACNLHGQLYNVDGDTLWPGGISVAYGDEVQRYPVVAPDGLGNWIVIFSQNRQWRAQKVNNNGELLWQEENGELGNGVPILPLMESSYGPSVLTCLTDPTGGLYVLFSIRNSNQDPYTIFLQRIDADGQIPEGWTEEGIVIANQINSRCVDDCQLIPRGDDGVWIAYRIETDIFSFQANISGIDSSGEDVLVVPFHLADCGYYISDYFSIASDGQDGFYCAWHSEEQHTLVAQRFSGEAEPLWADGAQRISDEHGYAGIIQLHSLPDERALVTWEDFDSLFAQVIYGEEELSIAWEDGEVLLHSVSNDEDYEAIFPCVLLEDGSMAIRMWIFDNRYDSYYSGLLATVLTEEGETSEVCVIAELEYDSYYYKEWANAIDSQGNMTWGDIPGQVEGDVILVMNRVNLSNGASIFGDEGQILRQVENIYAYPCHISKFEDEVRVLYRTRQYPGLNNICLQKLDATSGEASSEPWQLYENIPEGSISGTNVLLDDQGNMTCVSDVNLGDDGYTIHAQRIGPDGELLWGDNGVEVGSTDMPYVGQLQFDDGYVLVAWIAQINDERGIAYQKFDNDGEACWAFDGYPFRFFEADSTTHLSHLCALNSQQAISCVQYGSDNTLVANLLDEAGNLTSINLDYLEGSCYPSITAARDGVFLLAVAGSQSYTVAYLDTLGNLAWPEPVTINYPISNYTRSLLSTGPDANSAWILVGNYLQQISTEGTLLFEPEEGVELEGHNHWQVNLTSDNTAWVVFEVEAEWPDYYDYKYLHLDSDGAIFNSYNNTPQDLVVTYGAQYTIFLANDGEDGLLTVWRDGRMASYDIFAQRIQAEVNGLESNHTQCLVPDDFKISSIYPNPFNGTTRISVDLPAAGMLHVKLFDILGREVMGLVEDNFQAGRHQFAFDLTRLSSGNYFIVAEMQGRGQDVRKIVLVK